MEKVVMHTGYSSTGFGCVCDLLPGWTVSGGKDFGKFDAYVRESIEFYLDCCRADGTPYPAVFDGSYELTYVLDDHNIL